MNSLNRLLSRRYKSQYHPGSRSRIETASSGSSRLFVRFGSYHLCTIVFLAKILLATEGSKEALLAAKSAAEFAKSTGSELHVVIIFQESAYVNPYYEVRFPKAAEQLRQQAREEIQKVLDEQVERIRKSGVEVAQAHLRTGEPNGEIVALAEEIGAGLIVMGSRGLGGVRRARMGSVSDSVVRYAHCPVVVVRQEKEYPAEHKADFLT